MWNLLANGMLLLVLVPMVLPSVEASDVHGGDPQSYDCAVPPEHDPLFRTLRELECGVGSQVWDLAWYYPPVVYQAWCFATGECPCPHCPTESSATRNA